MDMMIQQLSHVASDSQLCMHWCFANLSAALEMGTYAVVPVHIRHETCLYHQKQYLVSRSAQHIHHQRIMLSDHVVSVSSHRMQQVFVHQAPSCACIDVLHI